MLEKIKGNWLFLLVVAQPFLDILAYFQYDSPIGTMAGYLRLLVMLAIPLYVLMKRRKPGFILLMGIIGIYCVLHVVSCYVNGYLSFFADVSYMLKVVQMPILAISFCYLFDRETHREQIVKGFVVNFIVICASMILAYITGTGVYTYDVYKIGYTGWFANANAQSIILISMAPFIIYFTIKLKKEIIILLSMFLITVVFLINGPKACYLAIYGLFGGIILFYIVDYFISDRDKKRIQPAMIITSVILIVGATLVYPLSPRYHMENYASGKREEENTEIEKQKESIISSSDVITLNDILKSTELQKKLVEIYKDSLDEGLVEKHGAAQVLAEYGWMPDAYTLADVRLQKRINAKLIWNKSDMLTKLFGIEYTEMEGYDLENDYPAIYYYYGYVGFTLYMLFVAYFVFLIIKTLMKYFKDAYFLFNFILALAYFLQIGLAYFSGAILRRPNASIYMALIIGMITYQCKKIEKRNEQ